jgi:Zn-dependent peptidase ImmA (M78 family)
MIPDQKKTSLNRLAAFIAGEFTSQHFTQLETIAESEGIEVYYDDYEDDFDGMLVCDEDGNFHIHINITRGNTPGSRRGRFSLAHELAHYFIDEQRIHLSSGQDAPHGSVHDFEHNDAAEEEADYFAGCLLMPVQSFRSVPAARKFSLDTILKLSNTFKTSVLATTIRFAECGTHEICAVISRDNIFKWFVKSKDFPNWAFRCRVGQPVPPTTVAGEFFNKRDAKYTGVEDVDPDDWFFANWERPTQMHEQCYYSESYGYVISLIWFD